MGAGKVDDEHGDPVESSDNDDDDDEIDQQEQQEEEGESSMIRRYWALIKDHTFVTKTNPNHIYVNFNLLDQELNTVTVMEHLRTILKIYSNPKTQIYVNPQLGFILYNQTGNEIVKYFYASANTALFPDYRLLSTSTLKQLESNVQKLYLLNWPFHAKMEGAEKSDLGFTLITNICYSVIIE